MIAVKKASSTALRSGSMANVFAKRKRWVSVVKETLSLTEAVERKVMNSWKRADES